MEKITEVYLAYLKMKGIINNRPYRLPKEPDLSIEKLRQSNQKNYDNLKTLSDYFNTKWQNIDMVKYVECGFKLFPNFTYINFLNDKILKHYIQLDKIQKFHETINKKTLLKSFKFIQSQLHELNLTSLKDYCKYHENEISLIIEHYLQSKIDSYVFVYILMKRYLNLSKEERDKVQNLLNRITEFKSTVQNEWELLEKMEDKIKRS